MLLLSELVANTMVRHGITAGERDHLTMPAQLPIQGQSRLLFEAAQEAWQLNNISAHSVDEFHARVAVLAAQ